MPMIKTSATTRKPLTQRATPLRTYGQLSDRKFPFTVKTEQCAKIIIQYVSGTARKNWLRPSSSDTTGKRFVVGYTQADIEQLVERDGALDPRRRQDEPA